MNHAGFRRVTSFSLAALMVCGCAGAVAAAPQRQKEIIAYVFPQNRVLAPDEVAATELTRVNYAFTNLKDGVMVEGFTKDKENFEVLNALKKKNPRLQVVPSVGGWTWSGQFSDMSLTKASRTKFIDSVVLFIEKYKLDGLDIDWEYPAQRGNGNINRPEDKHNYTLLLMELRQRLNVEGRKLHRHLVTSIATGSGQRFLDNTEMDKVAKYVDSVNLMTYDMYGPGDKNTGHDSPLYNNPADPKGDRADSVDWSVKLYEKAGVPANKIVVGVPFYSKRWTGVEATNNGLFQAAPPAPRRTAPATPPAAGAAAPATTAATTGGGGGNRNAGERGYGAMVGMLTQGYVRYWDPVAKAPYLYNPSTKVWVTYEDTESLLDKGDYVMDHKLGGMMFWEYTNDPSGMLLKAVNAGLQHKVPAPAKTTAKASAPAKAASKGQ